MRGDSICKENAGRGVDLCSDSDEFQQLGFARRRSGLAPLGRRGHFSSTARSHFPAAIEPYDEGRGLQVGPASSGCFRFLLD